MGNPKGTLKTGARGVQVGRAQTALNKHQVLPLLKIDGDFGPKTRASVGAFQERYRLKTSGEVDDDTWLFLNPYRTALVFGLLSPKGLTLPQFKSPFDPSNSPLKSGGVPQPNFKLEPHLLDPARNPVGYPFRYPLPSTPEPVKVDLSDVVFQPQFGPQYLTKPLWYSGFPKGQPPGASLSLPFQFWVTWRSKPKGLHTEISFGPGFAFNRTVSKDDSAYTLSLNAQVMVADIWASGSWHLLAPYAQAGGYWNFRPYTEGFGVNIGNQMTYEIIDDRLMLMLQPGFWINHDLTKNQTTYGPGVGLSVGGSF
ncbi:MAG TPA: peptidoglycan-binding domain-containing protein [Bryobacteraceae bacterium]|nr:peptidoglycan-binding domain-containing protein [Bryobacteraceae bacterium]